MENLLKIHRNGTDGVENRQFHWLPTLTANDAKYIENRYPGAFQQQYLMKLAALQRAYTTYPWITYAPSDFSTTQAVEPRDNRWLNLDDSCLISVRDSLIPTSPDLFSRKVFVGGLPSDIDEDELNAVFGKFGLVRVDWPHKMSARSFLPPKGYVFLIFDCESSVTALTSKSDSDDGKFFTSISSQRIKNKLVEIRPWRICDIEYVRPGTQMVDTRKTVFIGGVPRPLKAVQLADIMDKLYGNVCYASIDTDPELHYPKGAGRVSFSTQRAYFAAVGTRSVQLKVGDISKQAEVKPYVMDNQMCDECYGVRCNMRYAVHFCSHLSCLQYYCQQCWTLMHQRIGWSHHRPVVKDTDKSNFKTNSWL